MQDFMLFMVLLHNLLRHESKNSLHQVESWQMFNQGPDSILDTF